MAHITFIHGISNKPEKEALLAVWQGALSQSLVPLDLAASGVSCEMVYWADVLYGEPLSVDTGLEMVASENNEAELPQVAIIPQDNAEAAWLAAMEQRLGVGEGAGAPEGTLSNGLERIPLPDFAKDAFLKRFLRDVHHYLFNVSFSPRPGEQYFVRDEIRQRFVAAVKRGSAAQRPHIVVSHSMGTVIAYDCLKRVAECPVVDAFVTMGSPLGIDEIQDKLRPEWTQDDGFPSARVSGKWINYFDRIDPVSRLDPYLASDYRRNAEMVVEDVAQHNGGWWTHDVTRYLSGREVTSSIAALLG
jgi:hypothetical protein